MAEDTWRLRGYDVGRPVRRGRRGDARLARESASGERVVLRRLPVAGEPARERLLADVTSLAGMDLEHVVRLRRVLRDGEVPVLVYDDAPGGSLAELLGRRAALSAAELVTVLVPLCRTLASLHAAGLVHGDVASDTVVFTADGRPLLDAAGLVATDDGCGGPRTPGDDVRALAEVARAALGADAPPALVDVVRRALDPATRVDPLELAAAVRAAAAPVPVDLRAAAAPLSHAALAARRRATARRAAVAVVALAGVVAAAAAGRAWAARSAPAGQRLPSGPPFAATSPASDWSAVVAALDERRGAALAMLDEAALAAVYVPGSAPLRRDVETLRVLRSRRQRAVGGRLTLRRVDLVAQAGGRATLRVVDVLAAYDVLDAGGRAVRHDPGRGPRAFRLVLVRVGDGWRIAEEAAEAALR